LIQAFISWADDLQRQLEELGRMSVTSRVLTAAIGPEYHKWEPLSVEGEDICFDLGREYSRFCELAAALIPNRESKARGNFLGKAVHVDTFLNRTSDPAPHGDADHQARRACQMVREQAEILDRLPKRASKTLCLVPDTNSLIDVPSPHAWDFAFGPVDMILFPTVLQELDDLKSRVASAPTAAAARKVIGWIRETTERGDAHRGVSILGDLRLRMVGAEPSRKGMPSWLQLDRNDDRLIASVLDISRSNLADRVVLVTGDLNVENKARFARIPVMRHPGLESARRATSSLRSEGRKRKVATDKSAVGKK
jgi:hypothetical protein